MSRTTTFTGGLDLRLDGRLLLGAGVTWSDGLVADWFDGRRCAYRITYSF